jgi:hypothetical protein
MMPDSFLDSLPLVPLDGEFWCGRGNFQTTKKICGRDVAPEDIGQLKFVVYSSPPIDSFIQDGIVDEEHSYIRFDRYKSEQYIKKHKPEGWQSLPDSALLEDL